MRRVARAPGCAREPWAAAAAAATLAAAAAAAEADLGVAGSGPGVAGPGVAGLGVAGLGVAGPGVAGPGVAGLGVAGPGVVGPRWAASRCPRRSAVGSAHPRPGVSTTARPRRVRRVPAAACAVPKDRATEVLARQSSRSQGLLHVRGQKSSLPQSGRHARRPRASFAQIAPFIVPYPDSPSTAQHSAGQCAQRPASDHATSGRLADQRSLTEGWLRGGCRCERARSRLARWGSNDGSEQREEPEMPS